MKKIIGVGEVDFAELILNHRYYIDKTRFIKPLFYAAKVCLVTRPRRFGKTLTLSMIKTFLEMNYRDPSDKTRLHKIFSGLDVYADEAFCQENMGEWPVISLSFKSIEGRNFEEAFDELKSIIADEADRFSFLEESARLSDRQRVALKKLCKVDGLEDKESALLLLADSLRVLEECLYAHFGKNPILLIDEYDVPLQKARIGGYYDDMLSIIGRMFRKGLKDTRAKAFLTGCLRLAKESVFTGTNNFLAFGIDNPNFNDAIGFTAEEARNVLSYYNLQEYADEVRANYDGYRFAGVEIYCPWDLLCFCQETQFKGIVRFGNYWINSSSNDLILEFVDYADEEHLGMLSKLMAGKTVTARIDPNLSFAELNVQHSPEQLMSLLYSTGYLTEVDAAPDGRSILRIPNKEIDECFREKINSYFSSRNPSTVERVKLLLNGLNDGAASLVQSSINFCLQRFMSVRDGSSEAFYHGFLLSLVGIVGSEYGKRGVASNRETGDGYSDIRIDDYEASTRVILELKKCGPGESLEAACDKAIEQIRDRGYGLEDDATLRTIRLYGIAFRGKHCVVKLMQP